jgi:hypothetical protein
MTPEELAERDRKIEQLCLDALHTDGAHHKQWFLEQILLVLLEVEGGVSDWEPGIAP